MQKTSGKNQGIWLMVKEIGGISREISREMCVFASSINQFPNMLSKKLKERHIFTVKLLVLIFHDGNRSHFAPIGESL